MNPQLPRCERVEETKWERERERERWKKEGRGGVYKSSLLWLIHLGLEDMANKIHYADIEDFLCIVQNVNKKTARISQNG